MSFNLKKILQQIAQQLPGDNAALLAEISTYKSPGTKRIIDLDPIVTQSDTDQYETSLNGMGSRKESRAQVRTSMQENTTTDDIGVGMNHQYLTNDNFTGDNLLSAPSFTALKTEADDHIGDLNNPHQATLQQAYNQNQSVVLNDGNVIFINSTSGVLEAQITDSKGAQFHAPIYYLSTGQAITLTYDGIDMIYSSEQTTSGTSTINLQLEISNVYADNATFFAWNNSDQALSVISPVGVMINDTDNHTVSVATGALIRFTRISLNAWQSSIVSLSAGSGIDISEGGIISLDGTGASAAYGYGSVPGSSGYIGFIDFIHWLIPFSTNTLLVNRVNNFKIYSYNPSPGSSAQIGIQYTGTEAAAVQITFMATFQYASINTNSASQNYQFGANLNLTAGPDGSFAPIDIIGSGPTSGTFIDFTIYPNYKTPPLSLTFQVNANPGDVFLPLLRTTGPVTGSGNIGLTTAVLTSFLIDAQKIGDIGGTTAGVASLSGLTGNVNVGSSNNTVEITPVSGNLDVIVTLPYSTGAQTIEILSGASAISSVASLIYATTPDVTGMVHSVVKFTVTSDNSGDLIKLKIAPFTSVTFTAANQAMPLSCVVTPTALLGLPGSLSSGNINQLFADTTNQWIQADIEVAQENTEYTVWLSFSHQI